VPPVLFRMISPWWVPPAAKVTSGRVRGGPGDTVVAAALGCNGLRRSQMRCAGGVQSIAAAAGRACGYTTEPRHEVCGQR